MRVGYLLSKVFPYDKLLCDDAGPAIAREYGWIPCTTDDAVVSKLDCIVIDNRHHSPIEVSDLLAFFDSNPTIPKFLRVNDPFLFHKDDRWYQLCSELIDSHQVHFLSPYQPTGLLSCWLSSARYSQFVYAPFTYDRELEVSIQCPARQRLIAVSGNQRLDLYPLRYKVQRFSRLPFSRMLGRITRLRHPGYPEKIAQQSHSITRSAYVHWLSQFTAAFVDSSSYRIELLKYREIAYAGCAPIGDLPWSLHECPSEAFFEFHSLGDLISLRSILNDASASQHAASAYRGFMRATRCRSTWRTKVADSISRFL